MALEGFYKNKLDLAIRRINYGSFSADEVKDLIRTLQNVQVDDPDKVVENLSKVSNLILNYLDEQKEWEGDLDLRLFPIDRLKNIQIIRGSLKLSGSKIKAIENLFAVDGDLDLRNSEIEDLGILMTIGGDIHIDENFKGFGIINDIGGKICFHNGDTVEEYSSIKEFMDTKYPKPVVQEDIITKAKKELSKISIKQAIAIVLAATGISLSVIATKKIIDKPEDAIEKIQEDPTKTDLLDEKINNVVSEEIAPEPEVVEIAYHSTIEDNRESEELTPEIVKAKANSYIEKINNQEFAKEDVEAVIKLTGFYSDLLDAETDINLRNSLATVKDIIDDYFNNTEKINSPLRLYYLPITSLGKVQVINGDVYFYYSYVEHLENLRFINGNVSFSYSNVKSLDNLTYVGGNADFRFSSIRSLENLKDIAGNISFLLSAPLDVSNLSSLGGNIYVLSSQGTFELQSIEELNTLLDEEETPTR